VVLVVAGVAFDFGIPWLESYFTLVSTDDAYVSGYITYLGPRIASRVDLVAVHETDFVRQGEVLVRLDPRPFRLAVEQAEAALATAQADLAQARVAVWSDLSAVRANQYLAEAAVDQLQYQIASLKAAAADLKLDEAQRALAEQIFARTAKLVTSGTVTREQYDQDLAALNVARDRVFAQVETVQQARAQLGLPRNTADSTQLPADLEGRNPPVQTAMSNWATSLVRIGVPLDVVGLDSEALGKELERWRTAPMKREAAEKIVAGAPSVRVAEAKVRQARAALDTAELNLTYTEIPAPFDGFVTKRTVNPGDYVTIGQNLLAVQSLHDVWVDANFKETQVQDLRIGMPVNVSVDAYPEKVFAGRVAGFSPATGAALSLLPPENATGNFVKVVQRLPVRIELDEAPPGDTPLFVGLSVEPYVNFKAEPRGPHAGERLKLPEPASSAGVAELPAARKSVADPAARGEVPP
jgi:membrane fusion protein, multidrug efflux system